MLLELGDSDTEALIDPMFHLCTKVKKCWRSGIYPIEFNRDNYPVLPPVLWCDSVTL